MKKETYTLKTVPTEKLKLSIVRGNSKLGKGIYAYSTLPGDAKHLLRTATGDLLCDVPGTCTGNCEACFSRGCYAVNAARRYSNTVIPAWAQNTELLRRDPKGTFDRINAFIKKRNVKVFRINVSGELRNKEDLVRWNDLATKNPGVRFCLYTKNYQAVIEYMDALERRGCPPATADNLVINISQWHGVADAALPKLKKWQEEKRLNVFEYDDSNRKGSKLGAGDISRLAALKHCPAVTKTGKHAKTPEGKPITCDMCGRCYRKTGETTAVYAH